MESTAKAATETTQTYGTKQHLLMTIRSGRNQGGNFRTHGTE